MAASGHFGYMQITNIMYHFPEWHPGIFKDYRQSNAMLWCGCMLEVQITDCAVCIFLYQSHDMKAGLKNRWIFTPKVYVQQNVMSSINLITVTNYGYMLAVWSMQHYNTGTIMYFVL